MGFSLQHLLVNVSCICQLYLSAEMYGSATGFEVLNLNSNIKSLESYQSLYFDTIHLNDELGKPFLRNCHASYVFKHSSKSPRVKPAPDYSGEANSN